MRSRQLDRTSIASPARWADRAFERAIRLNDVYANARYFLGLSYANLERESEAIQEFERVKETNPDNRELDVILENLRSGRAPLTSLVAEEPETLPIEGE